MTDLDRLTAALADRYAIQEELGAGGWPPSTSPRTWGMGAYFLSRRPVRGENPIRPGITYVSAYLR